MINFLKIKNINITLFLILIFNQFLISAYAFNNRRVIEEETKKFDIPKKNNIGFNLLLAEINKDKSLMQEAIELNPFIEEILDPSEISNFKNNNKLSPPLNNNFDQSIKEPLNVDIENEKLLNEEIKEVVKPRKKKKFIIKKNKISQQKSTNKLPLPSKSRISSSEFKVPSKGYVNLKDKKISLTLKRADAMESLRHIAKLVKYGIVIIEDDLKKDDELVKAKITANFVDTDISDVFNSLLLSANLQAIVENNIIYVGKNILNKSLVPKISRTYRLNQVNAASVADYLSTLGAQISKVMVVSGSADGQEIGDGLVNKKDFKDTSINSYGIEGGPLFGLIGTADLRLQTITLIGSKDLMKTAEQYIKSLDVRSRQVALTIKIIDVSLTKNDLKDNMFEFRTGDTRAIINSGLALTINNMAPAVPGDGFTVQGFRDGGLPEGRFANWLEAKITNENAKVLASPTLILGENPNILSSGAASVDDTLEAATIGRPFKNEGFIKVGETVVTSFDSTTSEGVVTCTATEGTAGITFGAKVDKIDDNGFVTFALSPAISSVTKTVEISGCGIQNTLSVRKLDTGSIRVKDGNTLILTGVIKDEDNITTTKVPLLGDIPLIGSLFRNNSTQKKKSELIILVTPRILKDE